MANKQQLDLRKLIPSELRNELNQSLTANLFNRFLSEEQSVFISGQVGKITDPTAAVIQASDLDREQNALIPALYFKTGTVESVFTFDDLLNRMESLGVDVQNLKAVLAEQNLNLAPPISLDKFVNYTNYFWSPASFGVVPALAWNPTLLPEFYTIAPPALTSTIKLPIALATTRDVKLFGKDRAPEKVTLTFTTSTTFNLAGDQGVLYLTASGGTTGTLTGPKTTFLVFAPDVTDVNSGGHGLGDPATSTADLLFSFQITKGAANFDIGDSFEIDITYVSGTNTISFTPGPSLVTLDKGYVSNIVPDTGLMFIDGVRVVDGDVVLVKNQANPAQNGVYTVKAGKWSRAVRYSLPAYFPVGSRFFITGGLTQAGMTFQTTAAVTTLDTDPLNFTAVAGNPISQTNDWQQTNFWLHKDTIDLYSIKGAVQATRPIIEFDSDLQLNAAFDSSGFPSETGISAVQRKTRFNQLPQFDLFYYDRHHSKKTSGIFFYEEDPDFNVDAALQRRVKLTINSDYVFGLGVKDEAGRLLFFKKSGALHNIWAPGVFAPQASTIQFSGQAAATKGNVAISGITTTADNQVWTLTALTPTTFSVLGSRSGPVGTATVGTAFTYADELSFTITAGAIPFSIGDAFTFTVRNEVAPRYVKKNSGGNIVNVSGGPLGDTNQEGTWLVPRRMFENMLRSLETEIAFADLIDHFRSVIKEQDGFVGASFGVNNYRDLTPNLGFGGTIREYSSNFPLLSSLLIQQGLSPLSIIDFAEQQYLTGLSSVDQFLSNELANYIASSQAPITSSINANDPYVQNLLAAFEAQRAANQGLKDVFSDSTAGVKNWPITLPMMGIVPVAIPRVDYDLELGINVIVHHDGHISPLASDNVELDRNLVRAVVIRSDGTSSAGAFSESSPVNPYARQLWFKPSTNQLFSFNVVSDSDAPPVGGAGLFWYKRSTNQLYQWDVTNTWALSAQPISSLWTQLHVDVVRNSLILAVEQKLYTAVHPAVIQKANLSAFYSDPLAQIELAKFAAKYGYDTFAPIYSASDAFTWNYKTSLGHARWFDVYLSYFSGAGMLPTARPDLEPWRLIGYPTKAAASAALAFDWDTRYAAVVPGRLWKTQMWTDIMVARPGIKVCVNINTDQLLPPYVALSAPGAAQALLNTIPAGITNAYVFGDDGPVENVWRKSLEFNYGMARVYFKRKPLEFVTNLWGDTYFYTDHQIRLERNLMEPQSPSQFLLHGERLHVINQRVAQNNFIIAGSATSTGAATVRFEVTHVEDNRTFFYAYVNGVLQGIVEEGHSFNMSYAGVTFSNVTIDDLGIPFSLGDVLSVLYVATPDLSVTPPTPINPEDCGCVLPGTNNTLPPPTVTINSSWTFTPALTKKFIGFGQLFTNLLRFNYIDTDTSQATNAYRGWDIRLCARLGALIRGDSLEINTSFGILPSTAFNLLIKRSEHLHSRWISALRVQLVQAGTRVATAEGVYVPFGDGSDWTFRIETYNPQNPTIEYYALNTAGDYQTFNALQQQSTALAWKRFTEKSSLQLATTPLLITGVQNVVNFIYGYVDRLEELGFAINVAQETIIDAETGRNLDWQLEVEKLIDRIYRDLGPGEGHILNPFLQALWLNTDVGLMSRYSVGQFIDTNSAQAAFDVTGTAIPQSQLFVIRSDDSTVTYSNTPIFSAHLFTDEFEHVILFNDKLSDEVGSSTIFDPFLGMRIASAYLSFTRQAETTRKPNFNGFILSGHDVTRNVTSSVNAIQSYYDASKTFNEETTAKHALALLGFNKKDYFSNIGIADATQFNFWRGLIQAKGTNMSIDAFVNYKKFATASVDEYWAYKLAEYGDSRLRNSPEIKIEQGDCQQNFTLLQFFDSKDPSYDQLPLFTQIEKGDDARWFTIDDLGTVLTFDAAPISVTVAAATPGYYQLNNIFHNGDEANPIVLKNGLVTADAVMITASILKVIVPGTFTVNGFTWANPVKQSPVKLFDYQTNTLVQQIPLWHPAIGIHAYEPLEIINTISPTDVALYNQSAQTTNNPNYATLKPWGKKEVGRVWWDTSNLGYIPYYDSGIFPHRSERNSRWGNLAEWATVDLYEWVESTVPPSEYDALAVIQEGSSDIPAEIRASGKAALKTNYQRSRSITTHPIAWSRAGVGDQAAHPAFGPAFSVKVLAAGGALYADADRTTDIGLTVNRRFSAYNSATDKFNGEVNITGDLVYDIGSSTALGTPGITGIQVSAIEAGRLGNRIGQLNLTTRAESDGSVYLRLTDDFNFYQELRISAYLGTTTDVRDVSFSDFGIRIRSAGPLDAAGFASALVAGWTNVYVREGVRFTTIIPLPDTGFVNDETDPDHLIYEFGWKTWDVPTQAQLDADLSYPNNTWKPYIGVEVSVTATGAVVADMKLAPLTLARGIPVNRYTSTWSDWTPLTTFKHQAISDGASLISYQFNYALQLNRLSVYANGIQLSPQAYAVSGVIGQEVVQLVNILPEGTIVLIVYRAYQPTAVELAFDPTVKDDPTIQLQFKSDYQFTKVDVRSEAGVITSAKYYFWVQDKTVVQPNKSMSLVQATSILKNGPSQFMTLARHKGGSFDSCVFSGLNNLVTNNSTYKLRFTRNHILRDDPEQLNLKDVHTEWALIRRSQSAKIPATLWARLTDAIAGTDAGGNALPTRTRIDYDALHGTRTRFGFNQGQIFADTALVRASVTNTILNTSLTINLGTTSIIDYITALDFTQSASWFSDATTARATMDLIWSTARPRQINEIFFEVLDDALANNYEFTDLFKTSLISVYSTTNVKEQTEGEIADGEF